MTEATLEAGVDDAEAAAIAEETHATAIVAADERLAYRGVFQRLLIRPEIGAIIGAAAIWAFFWAVAAEFGKAGTSASILDVSATLGIMAVAVSLLMIGGEFDLSSGAATGALGIVTILLVKDVGELGGAGLSLHVAIPASLIVALGLGWFNGTMVERTGLPSFIVTLATFFILRGFKLGFSKLIIDNISVGRIDEGHGYDFWRPIFDYTWGRNDHQFGNDTLRYSLALVVGIAMLAAALLIPILIRTGASRAALQGLAGVGAVAAVIGFAVSGLGTETVQYTIAIAGLAVLALAAYLLLAAPEPDDQPRWLFGLGAAGAVLALLAAGYKWGSRDLVYTVGILGGAGLIAVAVYEMNYLRSDRRNPVGLAMFLGGAAGAVAGVLYMHNSDGVGANTVAAVVIGVSLLVGFVGLAVWRYRRHSPGGLEFRGNTPFLVGGGIAAVILGVIAARVLDIESQESVLDLFGNLRWPLVGIVALFAGYQAFQRSVGDGPRDQQTFALAVAGGAAALLVIGAALAGIVSAAKEEASTEIDEVTGTEVASTTIDWGRFGLWSLVALAAVVGAIFVMGRALRTESRQGRALVREVLGIFGIAAGAGFASYAFMFMTTEQGLRAILLGVLVLGGLTALAIAARKSGRNSPLTRGVVLTLMALTGLGLAMFIRSESLSEKFRNEAFTVTLMLSLLVFVWAVVSTFFETRRGADHAADSLGGRMASAGLIAVTGGVVVRLLYTTQEELDAGVTPANFRMSVLWFVGFTIFATWLLGRTQFGSWIFAVGGNKEAARQIGVPAARTKTQLFMLVSVAAWLVGLLLAFRLNTLQSGTGNGLEFEYIIAAVVGGTLLTGGYGSAFGAAIGAFIMAMSKQGIPAARWNSDWRFAFLGVILLTAVIANNFIKTKAEEAGR